MKNWTRHIYSLLMFALLLPVLSGCDQEDNVIGIFTDKVWKLTYIAAEGNEDKMYNFWGDNNTAYQNSMNALKEDANYIITFEGGDVNGTITGTFSAHTASATITGRWTADGGSRKFTTSDIRVNGSERDAYLGKAFTYGLRNAEKYSGDNNNLFIYYKEGQRTFIIFLHPLRK